MLCSVLFLPKHSPSERNLNNWTLPWSFLWDFFEAKSISWKNSTRPDSMMKKWKAASPCLTITSPANTFNLSAFSTTFRMSVDDKSLRKRSVRFSNTETISASDMSVLGKRLSQICPAALVLSRHTSFIPSMGSWVPWLRECR